MKGMLFAPIKIGGIGLRNRFVCSATYEGAADSDGFVGDDYRNRFEELARNQVAMIITGFTYISKAGRAMHPRQAGLDCDAKIPGFKKAVEVAHSHGVPIVVQLAHAGRQSLPEMTGGSLLSSTNEASMYYRRKPRLISAAEAAGTAADFARAAVRAREAGFDGVQLHAAHGYLLHQFLMKETNKLRNEYGIDEAEGIGTAFLELIIDGIREQCGAEFPILVKISGDIDSKAGFFPGRFDSLVKLLDRKRVAAIEISYGTMDYPMNIFRGALPLETVLDQNPLFRSRSILMRALYRGYIKHKFAPRLLPFSRMYNLEYAARAKTLTDIPVISVGGFRRLSDMETAVLSEHTDLISMSRPFLREPDLVVSMSKGDGEYISKCTNCNMCAVMCDSGNATKCYRSHNNARANQGGNES